MEVVFFLSFFFLSISTIGKFQMRLCESQIHNKLFGQFDWLESLKALILATAAALAAFGAAVAAFFR